MTGFLLAAVDRATAATSAQVTGKLYAASFIAPTPADLTVAVGAMETAYTDAAGRPNADAARKDIESGILGKADAFGSAFGKLTPGVYTFGSNVELNGDIYFEGTGEDVGQGDTDVFIIQITGNLNQAANYRVNLTGGALAKNIFWQVAGDVIVGAGAHMKGILLVKTAVLFLTGSSLNGRILSQTRADLQKNVITQPTV
jgi:hypothetical protein